MNFNSPVAAFCAAVSVAFCGVLSPASVRAAPPTETLVVSAARIPIPIAISGGSISVIDRAEIERRQQIFAADLLTQTPGISVSRSGGYGSQTQLRLRGAEANQVLVLIDGVEANDPAGNDEFAIEHLTTFDIERIEVVRGPQSALWGSDALAGVINIITRPSGDTLGGEVLAEAGAFDTIRGGIRLEGPVGPVRSAFSVSRIDSDGTNVSRTGSEDDGYDNTTASLNLAADPADNLSLSLTGRITDATKSLDLTDFFGTGLPEDSSALPESEFVLGFVGAGANLELMDRRWTHGLQTTWSSSNRNDSELIDPDAGIRAQSASAAADKYRVQYQTTWRPGRSDDSTGTALTFAVDQEWQKFSQRGAAFGTFDPNQDQEMDNTALIAELRLEPLDRVHLSFSGRSDDNSDFDDMSTFRATGAWDLPNESTRLRTSIGTGQKAPTFTERFGYSPAQFIGNPDLKPEESRGWEVGVDQQLLAGKVELGLTYFHEDLEDEIDGFVLTNPSCFLPPPPDEAPVECLYTAENLNGKSRRRGVEITADAEITRNLLMRANYTYVDSQQPDSASDDGEAFEIRRPRHSASLNGAYTLADDAVIVDVGIAYTGDRSDTFFDPLGGPANVPLDNYTLASAAVTWRVLPELSLLARVENAFNTTYEDVYGYNTPGIGAFLGFRATMGR